MKRVVATAVASVLLSGVVFASPPPAAAKDEVGVYYNYTNARNNQVYHTAWGSETRKVDGYFSQYGPRALVDARLVGIAVKQAENDKFP